MLLPVLQYGSQASPLSRNVISVLPSSGLKFLGAIKGCSLRERLQNDDNRSEVQVAAISGSFITVRDSGSSTSMELNDTDFQGWQLHISQQGRQELEDLD